MRLPLEQHPIVLLLNRTAETDFSPGSHLYQMACIVQQRSFDFRSYRAGLYTPQVGVLHRMVAEQSRNVQRGFFENTSSFTVVQGQTGRALPSPNPGLTA